MRKSAAAESCMRACGDGLPACVRQRRPASCAAAIGSELDGVEGRR
jgi:hypothetical protein